jgi:hypothetical protein
MAQAMASAVHIALPAVLAVAKAVLAEGRLDAGQLGLHESNLCCLPRQADGSAECLGRAEQLGGPTRFAPDPRYPTQALQDPRDAGRVGDRPVEDKLLPYQRQRALGTALAPGELNQIRAETQIHLENVSSVSLSGPLEFTDEHGIKLGAASSSLTLDPDASREIVIRTPARGTSAQLNFLSSKVRSSVTIVPHDDRPPELRRTILCAKDPASFDSNGPYAASRLTRTGTQA